MEVNNFNLKKFLHKNWNIFQKGDVGELNVWLNSTSSSQVLWTRKGSQSNVWRRAQITLKSQVNFKVSFEGIVGKGYTGDM